MRCDETNSSGDSRRGEMEYEREKKVASAEKSKPQASKGRKSSRQTKQETQINQPVIKSAHQQPATEKKQSASRCYTIEPKQKNSFTHHERMRLSVEHPLVLPLLTRNLILGIQIRMNQVSVLENLGEEERFLEIGETAAARRVDVVDRAVAAADAGGVANSLEAGVGPLF